MSNRFLKFFILWEISLLGKTTQRPNLTAGKLRARERAEASHERLVDPPGGIPGAGVGRRKGGNSGGGGSPYGALAFLCLNSV